MKKVKLSIGMIVKNEEKHLRNCLMHLKPLMDKVESELIIADTGSADNTVAIAREFTKNVLEIEWNNDFSEARNHTLRVAKGEWFMFVDADEYLENIGDMVEFFKFGEYKNYDAASIERRDYDAAGKNYEIIPLIRLCKITPELEFRGAVHEEFNIADGKFIRLRTYAKHYGYASNDDPDLFMRKLLRNLAILESEYEKDPANLSCIRMIAASHMSLFQRDKAKEYIDKGISLIKHDSKNDFFHVFYKLLCEFYFTGASPEMRQKAIDTVNEYLEILNEPSYASIDIYVVKGMAHYNSEEDEDAAEAFMEAYKLLLANERGELKNSEIFVTGYSRYALKNGETPLISHIIECYKQLGGFDFAFDEIILNQNKPLELITPFFDAYIENTFKRLRQLHPGLNESNIANMPALYGIVYHLGTFDACLKEKNVKDAIYHLKAAMALDPGVAHLIQPRYEALTKI